MHRNTPDYCTMLLKGVKGVPSAYLNHLRNECDQWDVNRHPFDSSLLIAVELSVQLFGIVHNFPTGHLDWTRWVIVLVKILPSWCKLLTCWNCQYYGITFANSSMLFHLWLWTLALFWVYCEDEAFQINIFVSNLPCKGHIPCVREGKTRLNERWWLCTHKEFLHDWPPQATCQWRRQHHPSSAALLI